MVEIRLPKCRLFLTEEEVKHLLKHDPELWETALRRGKVVMRARRRDERQEAIRRRRGGEQA
ncbi:MAG: hypothetical protein AB1700_15005 [Bacillota bacterium]